jgi:hypothetical protein
LDLVAPGLLAFNEWSLIATFWSTCKEIKKNRGKSKKMKKSNTHASKPASELIKAWILSDSRLWRLWSHLLDDPVTFRPHNLRSMHEISTLEELVFSS